MRTRQSQTRIFGAWGAALGLGAAACMSAVAQPERGEWLEVSATFDGDTETWSVDSPDGYTIIGFDGSWDGNLDWTPEAAFDGDFGNFAHTPDGSLLWVGLDLGPDTQKEITGIRIAPRDGFEERAVGATIYGANVFNPDLYDPTPGSDFDDRGDAVPLLTIEEAPPSGEWTTFDIDHAEGFRFVFYEASPDVHDSFHTDLAGIEFYGQDIVSVSVTGPALAQAGATVTLTADVQNAAGEVSYQWLRDGEEIGGATESTYVIADVSQADEGAYAVRVTDDETEITSAARSLSVGENVPAAGGLALTALTALFGAAGVWRLRKRRVSV